MITLPLITDWNICTPNLFRYLDAEYVDSFFGSGALRLSSFKQFATHENEQRLDVREGESLFIHRTSHPEPQTLAARAYHGIHAYVLSTSMLFDEDLMHAFECDSYLRILDSTNFGMAIARQIPGLIVAYEGPCQYQVEKIVEKNLGYVDIEQFKDPNGPQGVNEAMLNEFILSRMRHYPLFLKHKDYAHQVEYRFVWVVRERLGPYLDLKVPDAVRFCERPNPVTE